MMRMDRRDFNYIEHRLMVPCEAAMEAVDRLKHVGLDKEANTVMNAAIEFVKACRQVRAEL